VCFPVMALGIRILQIGWGKTALLIVSDPLLWIIGTAPLFLGVFAMLGGRQHDQVQAFSMGLEKLVDERTTELEGRNQAMRIVLDNVEQGLATVRVDGTLDNERSAAFDRWFKTSHDDQSSFSKVLAKNDNNLQDLLELSWEGLTDGFLPRDMAADQMPSKLTRDGHEYHLTYRPMGEDGPFNGALLIVNDITEEVARLAKESRQKEMRLPNRISG